MRLVFGVDFDSGFWPGPLAGRSASAGEEWVGPFGLTATLETALGLRGPSVPESKRIAALVPAVLKTEGYWSASAAVDPLSTARALLRARDELALHGWRGQPVSPRLGQLAAVTAGAWPGTPDRLRAVEAALALRRAEIESIALVDPVESLPGSWRSVLDSLRAQGTAVAPYRPAEPVAAADPACDLARAGSPDFVPRGDGTLQLLRPAGPLEAAEAVAGWLAARLEAPRDGLPGGGPGATPLLIGPDAVLDAALRRFGLPATGAGRSAADNLLLQVLPLVIAMGWSPPDPHRALELLTLPVSPVPPSLAARLRRALEEWPAVDSDDWRAAVRKGLESVEDAAARERRRERIAGIFEARVPAGAKTYPAEEVRRRVALVRTWLHGRIARADAGPEVDLLPWEAALAQCAALEELVSLIGLGDLPPALLDRLLREATAPCGGAPGIAAGAGLAAIGSPGGMAGSAALVVWWRFTRSSVPRPPPVPVLPDERTGLAEAGVRVPEPGETAALRALRWRRPLRFAGSTLLLVSPGLDEEGEEESPHPLWDEILGHLAERGQAALLRPAEPRGDPSPRRFRPPLLAVPRARVEWTVPAEVPLQRRASESPSSLESLLGCSFRYQLSQVAGVESGASAALDDPASNRLLGKVVHWVLERVLAGTETDPDRVAAEAERLFAEEGPRLAAALFLPGGDAVRAGIAAIIRQAAADLARRFPGGELRRAAVETTLEGEILGRTLRARPDLVLPGDRAILDLKSGGSRYFREALAKGASLQLAVYSRLAGMDGKFSPAGFYLPREARLLSVEEVFPKTDLVRGPGMAEVWRALERACGERYAELERGRLVAPGAGEEDQVPEAGITGGLLVLSPPCHFCDLDGLCGHRPGERK